MKGEILMKKLRKTKKLLTITAVIMMSLMMLFPSTTQAAGKTKLNSTNKIINVGDFYTVKLLNNTKKVKWSVSNKNIKIISKNNKQAKIKGIKKGTSYLKAKVGSKTYKCKVAVKEKKIKGNGTRENPYSAYDWHTVNLCFNDGSKAGKFKIKLLDYKDGKEAKKFIKNSDAYDEIKNSEECVYMEFSIKYISGKEEVNLISLLYMDGDIYNSKSNQHMWIKQLYGYKSDLDWLSSTSLYPGGSTRCYEAFTLKKGNTPITYRIPTGIDWIKGEKTYTWFTTKKK